MDLEHSVDSRPLPQHSSSSSGYQKPSQDVLEAAELRKVYPVAEECSTQLTLILKQREDPYNDAPSGDVRHPKR